MITIGGNAAIPARIVYLTRELQAVGTVRGGSGLHLDEVTFDVFVAPPSGWSSGKVRIDLLISDKSLRPRRRHLVVAKFIQAPNTKSMDDSINNTD
jgi:hypothetical protein